MPQRILSAGSSTLCLFRKLPRVAAVALALILAAAAQQAPQDDQTVRFQSSSQLVVEAVVVKDKNGKPIEDLKAEDFAITENGVAQTVAFCDYQKLDEAPSAETPLPRPVAAAAQPAAVPPDAPGDRRYRNRRLLILYFDMSSMQTADRLRALSGARKFLGSQITPSDLLAIMEFSEGSIKLRQDFTADRDVLISVIDKMTAVAAGMEDADFDPGAAFGQDDDEFNLFNTDRQLAALQTAFAMLGRVNEKKALVYFASGIRLSGVDNQAQLRATLNAAVRSNVVFFPVDARGLVASAPMGDASVASPGGLSMYTGAAAMSFTNNLQRSQDALYALAADSGGKALFDYNDLSVGIVAAQKATPSYYILGYYPTNTTPDGKWRRITVALKEFPSAKLEYRPGYFAPKEFKKFNAADKERQLEEALMLEDPITDLTIAMEVNYFQLNDAEYYIPVMLKIPGSELALARKGGAERTSLDFMGEIKDEYGTTYQNIRDKVEFDLSGATAAELAKRQIQYDTGYTLLPGVYSIKVLARDNETGRMGTYLSKFNVPNLKKVTERIHISSVVLSSQRIALKEALYTAGKDKEQITNPLVQDGQKLIPSVTRVFSRNRDLFVYLQAYEPTAEAIEPLVAFVSFYRGQSKAFETPPLPVSEALNNRLKTIPLKFSIGLGKLAPGKYDCQVTVLNPATRQAAFWRAPVMVAP